MQLLEQKPRNTGPGKLKVALVFVGGEPVDEWHERLNQRQLRAAAAAAAVFYPSSHLLVHEAATASELRDVAGELRGTMELGGQVLLVVIAPLVTKKPTADADLAVRLRGGPCRLRQDFWAPLMESRSPNATAASSSSTSSCRMDCATVLDASTQILEPAPRPTCEEGLQAMARACLEMPTCGSMVCFALVKSAVRPPARRPNAGREDPAQPSADVADDQSDDDGPSIFTPLVRRFVELLFGGFLRLLETEPHTSTSTSALESLKSTVDEELKAAFLAHADLNTQVKPFLAEVFAHAAGRQEQRQSELRTEASRGVSADLPFLDIDEDAKETIRHGYHWPTSSQLFARGPHSTRESAGNTTASTATSPVVEPDPWRPQPPPATASSTGWRDGSTSEPSTAPFNQPTPRPSGDPATVPISAHAPPPTLVGDTPQGNDLGRALGYPIREEDLERIVDTGVCKPTLPNQRWCVVCFTEVFGDDNWNNHRKGERHVKRKASRQTRSLMAATDPVADVPGARPVIIPIGPHPCPATDINGNRRCLLCEVALPRELSWPDHVSAKEHRDRVSRTPLQDALCGQYLCLACNVVISGDKNVSLHVEGTRHKKQLQSAMTRFALEAQAREDDGNRSAVGTAPLGPVGRPSASAAPFLGHPFDVSTNDWALPFRLPGMAEDD